MLDTPYDVILRIEASGCQSCTEYDPIYKELAKQYETTNSNDIKFLTINGIANEIEGHRPEFFPTVLYFPLSNKSNSFKMDGINSKENTIKFIKSHQSHELTHPGEKILKKEDL